jgi:hypothetical protein
MGGIASRVVVEISAVYGIIWENITIPYFLMPSFGFMIPQPL